MQQNRRNVTGVAAAISQYGEPARRAYGYQVSEERWRYWESVCRKRAGEVVLLLQRPHGKYLVHTKAFYPVGAYRLLSGGIKPGEDLVAAVLREAHEETGLRVEVSRFLALAEHDFSWEEKHTGLVSYLFLLAEQGGTPISGDADESITDFREVSLGDLQIIAEELESLPAEWRDWGLFRASMHRLAVELLSGGPHER
jgi:8-oxo-dGTP pyrophosphatase MutT (NUDIX family)